MSRGRIEKALSGFYYVRTPEGLLQCRARGKFRREGISPLVGDWVQVRDLGGDEGFVEAIEPRQNRFARPAAASWSSSAHRPSPPRIPTSSIALPPSPS